MGVIMTQQPLALGVESPRHHLQTPGGRVSQSVDKQTGVFGRVHGNVEGPNSLKVRSASSQIDENNNKQSTKSPKLRSSILQVSSPACQQ